MDDTFLANDTKVNALISIQTIRDMDIDSTNHDEQNLSTTNTDEVNIDRQNSDEHTNANYMDNPHETDPNLNDNNLQKNTQDNTDFIDIPPHLLISFRIIYTLKLKLNKLQTNLENLQEHKNTRTLPPGLRIHHKSKFYLDKQLSERWENTLTDASLVLLDITIDHHKHSIQDTQHKLQHRTEQLKKKCDENTAQRLLNKTDTLFMKYTTRSLMATNKTTKRLKRLQNTGTQSKHTTPHNPSTHTRTNPRQPTTKNNTIPHRHNTMQTPTNNPHAQTTITSQTHTPLSRHVHSTQPTHHAHTHRSLNTLQTGHKHTPQHLNHNIRNMKNTQTPQTQHSTHTHHSCIYRQLLTLRDQTSIT